LLHQQHTDIAAALLGRSVERIRKLLYLVSHPILLKVGRDHRKAILKVLPFPRVDNALRDISEVEPESKMVRVPVVVPDSGTAIDSELRNGAVPCQAHNVAGAMW